MWLLGGHRVSPSVLGVGRRHVDSSGPEQKRAGEARWTRTLCRSSERGERFYSRRGQSRLRGPVFAWVRKEARLTAPGSHRDPKGPSSPGVLAPWWFPPPPSPQTPFSFKEQVPSPASGVHRSSWLQELVRTAVAEHHPGVA